MTPHDDAGSRIVINDDWNQRVIEEFREHGGWVGGRYEGLPMLLLHHRGRRSGIVRVNPLVCRPLAVGRWAIFASKGGAPSNPQWYLNLVAHPRAHIEVAEGAFDVTARTAEGEERDQIWIREKEEVPRFADYEKKGRGRIIPVAVLEKLE